jgi:serine/threonine-protein kinase
VTIEAGTSIGKYVVKRKLAEGGMAEIYLATAMGPEGFEKEVVIKRVRSFLADDEGFVRMFIEEARLASRLNHANVVQIFDFDKHDDSYYLAMEYVRGCSLWELRKRCREKGVAVPPLLVAHIGAQVAAGLHYAHRLKSPDGELLGLVHRDVTPHNVLLSLDGAVKLTDFGIAKAGHTQSGMLKGKFAYMSPEQARGEEVDARTDVFALGIVLWEMLTGGRLFDGDSDIAVLRSVKESVIASTARLNPEVPEDLDKVVATALERDLEARFQSAGELERALAQCVLRNAKSLDDTDVATFVRRLLDAPLTQFIPTPAALMERSQRNRSGSTPVTGSGTLVRSRTGESPAATEDSNTSTPTPAPREPTAVLPRNSGSSSSERNRSVRTEPPEEPLVSAPTMVLPRDVERGGETRSASSGSSERPSTPMTSVPAVRDSRPVPVASPEAQGSAPIPVAPVRMAQVMPAVTSASDSAGAKGKGKGLWVGAGVAALVLIGGAAALVMPSQTPAPTTPPAAQGASSPASPGTQSQATAEAQKPVATPAAPPAETAVPSDVKVAAPTPPASGPSSSDVADVGVVAAVQPAPASPPAQTGATGQNTTAQAQQAAPAEARGTLIVRATPYATVLVSGQKPREVQGTARYSLAPGTYKVTFQHPASASETHEVSITPNGSVTRSFAVRKR